MVETGLVTRMRRPSNADWLLVQQSTFTKWTNNYLNQRDDHIDDIFEEFRDGIKLITLLEVLSGETVTKRFNKSPKMRIQKMENLNQAFTFMLEKGLTLTNIGSADILDGNNKLVLGLLWTLILRFQVTNINVDGVSGKEGLLLWCQRCLSGYPGIDMKNFTTSWTDGLAFCGLIHKFHPDLIDFASLTKSDAVKNVELAFQIAEDKLRIPQLLNVADVADHACPDEKSMVTYVSLLFQKFAASLKKQMALTTIRKAVNIARRHESLSKQYTTDASTYESWLLSRIESLEHSSPFRSVQQVDDALNAFHDYKCLEKPEREALFLDCVSCFGRLQLLCKSSQRSMPPDLTPTLPSLEAKRVHLHDLEVLHEEKLRVEFQRFEEMECQLRKVSTALRRIEDWLLDKEKVFELENDHQVSSTMEAEGRFQTVALFEQNDLARYQTMFQSTKVLANALPTEHSQTEATLTWVSRVASALTSIETKATAFKAVMEKIIARQKELDAISKDCIVFMRDLQIALEDVFEDLEMPLPSCTNVASAREMKHRYESKVATGRFNSVIQEKYQSWKLKHDLLSSEGRTMVYPDMNLEKAEERMKQLDERREKREKELHGILEKFERCDRLCLQFAHCATAMEQACQETTQRINDTESNATLEDQLQTLQALQLEYVGGMNAMRTPPKDAVFTPNFEEDFDRISNTTALQQKLPLKDQMYQIESINAALDAEYIFTNAYTTSNIQSLRSLYKSLQRALKEKMESLQQEIALQAVGNVTTEQLMEMQQVFQHFDSDGDGALSSVEFIKACDGMGIALLSVGEEASVFAEYTADTFGTRMNFRQFSRFCVAQLESGSSKEDVLKAFKVLQILLREEEIETPQSPPGDEPIISLNDLHKCLEEDVLSYMAAAKKESSPSDSLNYKTFTEEVLFP